MGSYPDEFPFSIMEVVELLNLRIRRQQANSVYVDCPFCGDRRGRMNVNFVKNGWILRFFKWSRNTIRHLSGAH